MELGSRQNMTDMDTKRAGAKCVANALWFVSFAELFCLFFSKTLFMNFYHIALCL